MPNTPQARGYGITKSDMEASRLVFVYLKDSRPRRKVAVPVPDQYTWEEFQQQIKTKLKLTAVGDIILASSGQKITSLDELHDIDELIVEEAPAPSPQITTPVPPSEAALRSGSSPGPSGDVASGGNGPTSPVMYRQPSTTADKHRIVMADSASQAGKPDDPSGDKKYVKRTGSAKRFLQRIFPGWQPGLPTSAREAVDEKAGDGRAATRRRRKRSVVTIRSLLLVLAMGSCFATMIILYMRVSVST